MTSSQFVSLESLVQLNEKDQKLLTHIADILKNKNPTEMKELIAQLPTYPLKLLYALSEKDPTINALLETEPALQKAWSEKLKRLRYPNAAITSFDKTVTLSLFSQLKGALLLSELTKHSNPSHPSAFEILNKACDIGMFQAYIIRLNLFSDLITQANVELATRQMYLQLILTDANQVSNLYWSMGCMDSTFIIFKALKGLLEEADYKTLMDLFFADKQHFSWLKKYDENCPQPITLLQLAVENLYVARIIADFPQAKAIKEQLGQGSEFTGYDDLTNYNDFQTRIVENLESLNILSPKSFCRNAFQHAIARVKEIHPAIEIASKFEKTEADLPVLT